LVGFNAGSQLAISGDNATAVAGIIITTNIAAATGLWPPCLLLGPYMANQIFQ
jgi:ammonia channel protein AmtB